MKKPAVLMILDGYGLNSNSYGNAVMKAKKPNMDRLSAAWPTSKLQASGAYVGLPDGQMGNSEVGHLNIGAGRIVYQELTRITGEIENGKFYSNFAFMQSVSNAMKHDSALHLWGLLSDGGVHSHITHLYALLKLARNAGLKKVYVHAFLDGRDTAPKAAKGFIKALEERMERLGIGEIATISGRYYAMDRDNRWERIQLAYDAMANGGGEESESALKALERAYKRNETDEFVRPSVIVKDGEPVATVNENDSVIMFNFRPDRARQITRVFTDKNTTSCKRERGLIPLHYVCLTQYDQTMPNVRVAYEPQSLTNTLGEYISIKGMKQLRIAETEKYAHVTFFFNGGKEEPFTGEKRIMVQSPKVATYDLKPEMSAREVCDKLVYEIKTGSHDFILVNFANPDMVGHTGVFDAAVKAIETIDECVGKVSDVVLEKGGFLFITADHGNADEMLYENGSPMTTHSLNPVPVILLGAGKDIKLREGKLADIAPTLLELMDLKKPREMDGVSLIKK
jgi:2,3-bisphosphoglycerate-independent phosphoglycerate mutase